MKVLFVEDKIETIKGIVEYCKDQCWTHKIIDKFDDFEISIDDFDPDVIVLDWKDDADDTDKGDDILEKIWLNGYKPIIIFSAFADIIKLGDKYKSSNLIRCQPKGDEQPVIEYLDMISPFVQVISSLKKEFNDALINALNSIEMMSKTLPLDEKIMRYVFAKRVSTYFDGEYRDETPPLNPPPWIQYIYPAISNTLCVCDILRSIPDNNMEVNNAGQPEEYYINLTPSCDVAQSRVTRVLCAKCCSKNKFHDVSTSIKPSNKQLNKIISLLNTGYKNGLVPLPGIPNVIPYLTINLKEIVLHPIEEIAPFSKDISDKHKYCRIASIDSPYREQIVWAHMINSCRPGVPDRNMDLWAKVLMSP